MIGPVRVALIGAGVMANRYHYPSLASFDDVELVGISDLIEDKARETATRFGIPAGSVFTEYRRMLAETSPDAVYVLMPPQILYEPAHYCLTQGLHVFVEKPLALTTNQARIRPHGTFPARPDPPNSGQGSTRASVTTRAVSAWS